MSNERGLKIAVCDDEKAARDLIAGAVKQLSQDKFVCIIDEYSSCKELGRAMAGIRYDLLLLDIEMDGQNGIEFAKELRKKNVAADVIYVSGREDFVFDSLAVHPFGFIRKNNFFKDVVTVMGEYFKQAEGRGADDITVKTEKGLLTFPAGQILYVEGCGKTQIFHLQDGQEIEVKKTMNEIGEILKEQKFFRIHSGYLVNFAFIRMVTNTDVVLKSGQLLPISRRNLPEVRKWYLNCVHGNILV